MRTVEKSSCRYLEYCKIRTVCVPYLQAFTVSEAEDTCFRLSLQAKKPASRVPEMECHTQDTAQITAA